MCSGMLTAAQTAGTPRAFSTLTVTPELELKITPAHLIKKLSDEIGAFDSRKAFLASPFSKSIEKGHVVSLNRELETGIVPGARCRLNVSRAH